MGALAALDPHERTGIVERDPAQRVRVQPRRLRADQHDRLVAPQTRRLVDPATTAACVVESALGASHEERRVGREPMKAAKIGSDQGTTVVNR